ncbi:zinc finger domain-containing protein [Nonomuraea turkmeniaca]|uniref:zinc finger domain-containing protein n=1 Tax=Nonomuraea turkmeniaca TaxID=103838 RepID=UPI003CCC4DCE
MDGTRRALQALRRRVARFGPCPEPVLRCDRARGSGRCRRTVDCPMCEAPAGSTCRTRGGKVAPKYHTPRFMRVPQLRTELEVRTPAERGPGRVWQAGPAVDAVTPAAAGRPTRVGYGRCSTRLTPG